MGNYLVSANIDIGLQHYPIDKIMQMIKCGDLILDRTFRKTRTDEWSQEKKSSMIESLMIHVPIGIFYFEMTDDDKYIAIDGWKRLDTLNRFMNFDKDSTE